MATKRSKPEPWRDGVRKVGPGRYALRIVARDPETGEKIVDTERVVDADNRLDAQNKRAELRKELLAAALGNSADWTVSRALEKYLPTLQPGTLHSWGSHSKKIVAAFGSRRLSSLKPDEIQRFIVAIPVRADTTANNVRTLLNRLFVYARGQGQFTGANPVKETSPRKTPKTRAEKLAAIEKPPRRALWRSEVRRYLEAFPTDLRALVTIQLLLGCRFGEVTALQWGDVRWDTGHIRVVRGQYKGEVGPTKNDRQRWSALGPVGIAVLRVHRERMEQERWPGWETWIFPRPVFWSGQLRSSDLWHYETVRQWVVRVQREQGLDLASRTHAVRHTFITASREHRQDDLMRAIVGHSDESMTETYTDQSVPPVAKPMAAFAALMEGSLVGPEVTSSAEGAVGDSVGLSEKNGLNPGEPEHVV